MSLLSGHADRLSSLAPAGFYVGLRVGFSFPSEEMNRLPEDWVEHYTALGLVVYDPVMKWVYANDGFCRWSDVVYPDPAGVLAAAADFGLYYGAVVSITTPSNGGKRSYGNFARNDREFEEVEMEELFQIISSLHNAGAQQLNLTAAEIEALRLQSQGLRLKQIAAELDISMSAVKARLSNAKRKLGASTPSQAASLARSRGLL